MENVELALKNSYGKKDETLTGAAQNGDDFFVDDLFDFPNDDDDVSVEDETESKVEGKRGGVSVSLNDENTLQGSDDFPLFNHVLQELESLPIPELAVPLDVDGALEFVSNLVNEDDAITPCYAPTNKPVWLTGNRTHSVEPVKEESCVEAPPSLKIRSKRARTGVSAWSLGSPELTDSSSSYTTSSTSSSSGPTSPLWLSSGAEFLDESMAKLQKKKKRKVQKQTLTQTRKCSHCGVQKTPQWRAGPLGAKTLCNACGVRYKSGRLLPEYRPACSPTFSSELHSNHHRKVVEMRRKKETSDQGFKSAGSDGSGCAEFLKK